MPALAASFQPTRRQALALALGGLAGLPAATWPLPAWSQRSEAAADIWWLDRLTWGATPAELASLQRIGRSAWLAQQLAAPATPRLPEAAERRVAELEISSKDLMQRARALEDLRPPPKRGTQGAAQGSAMAKDSMAPAMAAKDMASSAQEMAQLRFRQQLRDYGIQAQYRAVLRAAYAPGQLREQMVWFWMNHFSINGRAGALQFWLSDYEDRAVRPQALGRFRDLLEAVVTHPAMLIYLNNNTNMAGRINENLARELMELHTLGVDGGYTQADVQSLARVLTGLGVDMRGPVSEAGERRLPPGGMRRVEGFTVFLPGRHEDGSKVLLGKPLAGEGWAEIEAMLDRLASHPSTARHVSRQMARHFVGDDPPEALVNRMAKRFQDTHGQIAEVVKAMVEAPEFERSMDHRFKLPMQFVVSAWRLLWPDAQRAPDHRRTANWLQQLGQPVYARSTPDGYPADADYWNGSGQLTARFELARQWASTQSARAGAGARGDDQASTLEAWLQPTLSQRTRDTLATAKTAEERLAWLISSPEFMTR